jgi:hypothetical protein
LRYARVYCEHDGEYNHSVDCELDAYREKMPAIVINDPQFTTPYPTFSSDTEVCLGQFNSRHISDLLTLLQGWSILIQAQQVLVSATQFIGDLNKCLTSQSGLYYMFERMQQLDAWTTAVITQAELLPIMPQSSDFGDHNESITALSIRAIARIKLARYAPQCPL